MMPKKTQKTKKTPTYLPHPISAQDGERLAKGVRAVAEHVQKLEKHVFSCDAEYYVRKQKIFELLHDVEAVLEGFTSAKEFESDYDGNMGI
jgi:hypothetical protein